jgi:2-hydroxychromene-2-carboxylate isomerase
MGEKRLEFWFDFSCPYAYLASTQVEALAKRTGAELDPRPMLLGGVFRARSVPQNLYSVIPPARLTHNVADQRRWARWFDVPLVMPETHPRKTVTALRALLTIGPPYMPIAHRFFRAYWVDGVAIEEDREVARILDEAGLDGRAIVERTKEEGMKADLQRRTDEAIERGIFGAPAFFVNGELFWGQDRMAEVELALGGKIEELPPASEHHGPTRAVELYFDYASPASAIAVARAEALLGDALRLKPVSLEEIRRVVGPSQVMSEAKKRYIEHDLARQARRFGLEAAEPNVSVGSTQLALRTTIEVSRTAPNRTGRLARALFHALWVEGLDLADSEVARSVIDRAGFDGAALLSGAGRPEIESALAASTKTAIDSGVFDVPSMVIRSRPEPSVFFGSDRLDLAVRAARGDDRLL